MSHALSRSVQVAFTSLAALCFACGADQNRSSNSAENQQSEPESAGSVQNGPASVAPPPGTSLSPAPEAGMAPSKTNELATPKPTSTPPASTVNLTEAHVAMITDLANTAEIEQGKLAQTKAKSPAVKKFAAMMIKHHTEAKNEQAKLYKQLNLTPTQSQPATALKEDADKTIGSLRAADGSAFDMAYMNSQVDAHQKVLDSINQVLLPAASDQKLVDGLNKMKKTVEEHLDEARSIQAELAKGSGSTTM
jgi:putative membrane protein